VTYARRRGRPPGSGRKAAAGGSTESAGTTGAKRGRPAGSGKRRGRPPGSGKKAAGGSASGAGATTTSTGTTGASAPSGGAKRGRKSAKASITAGQLASRQLQGRYLALVRQFPENRRAQYAKTAKEKGREAAIQEMQDALK
jgi:hypothetical protein